MWNFDFWKGFTLAIIIFLISICVGLLYLTGFKELFSAYENYIFAFVAIFSGFVAFLSVERQILQQSETQKSINEQKLKANKVGMLFPLNIAYQEMVLSIKQLASPHQTNSLNWKNLHELVKTISLCIEFENEENAKALAKVCERIQLVNARYQSVLSLVQGKTFIQDSDEFQVEHKTFYRSEIIVELAATMDLISILFPYGRLEKINHADTEFKTRLNAIIAIHCGIDLSNHPIAHRIRKEIDQKTSNSA